MTDSFDRKQDHIHLCLNQNVQARHYSTFLDQVELVHQSLPQIGFDDIDISQILFDKDLQAPLLISGMTGGTPDARTINRGLARVAQHLGIAFGLGSQRPMLDDDELADTYYVRDIAPDIVLLANLGGVQLRDSKPHKIQALIDSVDADALVVHLNPAQEMMQPEGDRDFKGVLEAIEKMTKILTVPIIVKETGCGLSRETIAKLSSIGVKWVDTAGRGGTSWTGVETLRNPDFNASNGELFWDWGIPTAASILFARQAGMKVIGSGGIRNGLDVAKAIALGSSIVGMALPWLRAFQNGDVDGAIHFGSQIIRTLKIAMLLTASDNLRELRKCPRVIGPLLKNWLA